LVTEGSLIFWPDYRDEAPAVLGRPA
jgi:hypothetical protein